MASLIEKYQGVKPAKPYKYKPFNSAADLAKFAKASAPAQKRLDTLIKDRNDFYKTNYNITKEPKYTFNEAMSLANEGYTGLYGRSPNKQTVGLMGPAWGQAYALDRLRKGKQMLSMGLYGNRKAELDFMAADSLAPGTKAAQKIAGLVGEFAKYGGEDKYVARYGTRPAVGTKYGILFNTNNRATRRDDVTATYQNNLVKAVTQSIKNLSAEGQPVINKFIAEETLMPLVAYKIDLTSTRAKPSLEKIKQLEDALAEASAQVNENNAQVEEAMGGPAPSTIPTKPRTTGTANTITTALGGLIIGGPAGAVAGAVIGNNSSGNAMAAKAIDYMSGLAESDVLNGHKTYWKRQDGKDLSIGEFGLVGFGTNVAKGVARFGAGLPLGIATAIGEGVMAVDETMKVVKGEKDDWGEGIDFQLGDAIWSDYAQRYYDPFAYQVDSNGNYILDEAGQKKFQGYWNGTFTADNYDALGEAINNDPVAYALDVLDVVPIIGFGAKAASVASVLGKVPRVGGKVGLVKADIIAVDTAKAAILDPEGLKAAQSVLESLKKNPDEAGTVTKAEIDAAKKVVEENSLASEALALAQKKIAGAPSPRKFRQFARAAINGNELAIKRFAAYKTLGLEFNKAENSWSMRMSSQFEPRTKILEKPSSVLNQSDAALRRLPASPLVRGGKNAYTWVGRTVEGSLQKRVLSKPDPSGVAFNIATKLIDMPLVGYRWNYTKAVKAETADAWGDTISELARAAKIIEIDGMSRLTGPQRQAIESELFGGTGEAGPPAGPTVQRQALQDKLDSLPRDANTGEVVRPLRNDANTLQKKINDLLDEDLAKVDVDRAAAKFDEDTLSGAADLRGRIADPNYKSKTLDDNQLDMMVDLYRRLMKQDETIRRRLKHEDMSPTSLATLRHLYTEAMTGLHLTNDWLFDKSRGAPRLGMYTRRVLRVNTVVGMYLTRLVDTKDDAAIIDAAQSADRLGTVFEGLDPVVRKAREQDLITVVRTLVDDNAGIFRDGQGGAGDIGRPIMIRADIQDAGAGFVNVHIPRLRHTVTPNDVDNGLLVDETEVFTVPKEFFASKNNGKGAAILEDAATGRELLETGALNGMADIYPNARFYSEKVAETGRDGIRKNERQIKSEHVIATSALREHSIAQIVKSQINHFTNKITLDMGTLAESQAVMVPASRIVGKTAQESGYLTLKTIRPFFDIEEARVFAKERGVEKEFEDHYALYEAGLLDPVSSTMDVASGMGIRKAADGTTEFLVRGGMQDWVALSINESLKGHSALAAFKDSMYATKIELPDKGYVLAIPLAVDKQLSVMAIKGDQYAEKMLSHSFLRGTTNVFKWLVLNANPKFISNNVIGGLTMLMIHNPAAAVNILTRAMQTVSRKSGDGYLSNIVNESRAVKRQLQYEFNHNIYRRDSGVRTNSPANIRDIANKHEWARKYLQNFGYTTVSAFEEFIRNNVAVDYLKQDAGFNAFMDGKVVDDYIRRNQDWDGNIRTAEEPITRFEAAADLLLDRNSEFFDPQLKHSMRYTTNTVSGNYHRFGPMEQFMRNFLMPFYAWQRHSATFTYRMAVDKPITTNVLYNVGQYGYVQASESGVPDYMMMSVPVPEVLKEKLGVTSEDFRVDLNTLSPYATTGDMLAAGTRLLTGENLGRSVFEFGNPYANLLIKDQTGVDPRTGRFDFSGKDSGRGGFGAVADLGENLFAGTYFGRGKSVYEAVETQYVEDSLANKYAAIDNASDIYAQYDEGESFSDWRLSVPKMSKTVRDGSVAGTTLNLLGFKTQRLNLDALDPAVRAEAVGAFALKMVNEDGKATAAQKAFNGVKEWQRRRDYTMQVAIPALEAQGADPDMIMMVRLKIESEKPKSARSLRILQMLGG